MRLQKEIEGLDLRWFVRVQRFLDSTSRALRFRNLASSIHNQNKKGDDINELVCVVTSETLASQLNQPAKVSTKLDMPFKLVLVQLRNTNLRLSTRIWSNPNPNPKNPKSGYFEINVFCGLLVLVS